MDKSSSYLRILFVQEKFTLLPFRPQESFFELHALCPKGELWVSTYEIGYCTTIYEMDSTVAVVIVSTKWKGQERESVQKRGSRECMYAIVPREQDII